MSGDQTGAPELLSVRETARRLGVHENTIRNWVKQGLLPTAKVPGARFHRFDARDVQRLQDQRGASVLSVAPDRRTLGPELVGASQLHQWAATREAQDTFPEVMRRLFVSTTGLTGVSVRAGDGVSAGGWDGHAESEGTSYLPKGSLYFEFGVGRDSRAKADADYKKRREDPAGAVPSKSIFIFATPRRWPGADEWAAQRRADQFFRDVRVLDADDLEGWLQASPTAHYWTSEQLGRSPRDGETLERWWNRFQVRTDPALRAELFRSGRDKQCQQLSDLLNGDATVTTVQAGSRDEAVAFLYSVIGPTHGTSGLVDQALVISSADVWNRVSSQPGRILLVPLFNDPEIFSARSHHIILPAGPDEIVRASAIILPPPERRGAANSLKASGIPDDRADRLAALARRSLPALMRTLARDPRVLRPSWARSPAAAIIAPLVLAGAWSDIPEDKKIISLLADVPWDDVEAVLLQGLKTDDPPFVRSGGKWHLTSAEEAFLVLHDSLRLADLDRWHRIAGAVLLSADPTFDHAELISGGSEGIDGSTSAVLRKGLAQGAALLSSLGNELLGDGVSGSDQARRLVQKVLRRANTDTTAHVWRSLADVLPLLAEAAPNCFLEAVDEDLSRPEPILTLMFQDNDQGSGAYGSSSHTGLLWALETLCWSKDLVAEASYMLARLHTVDPGGRLSNRPLTSLQEVLAGWVHNTAAPVETKIGIIDYLRRRLPDVGWKVILGVWPSSHAISHPPHDPRFHDWKPDEAAVLIPEWIDYIGRLVRIAIDSADTDPQRWADLGVRLGPLPPAERKRLIDGLDLFSEIAELDSDQRLLLWEPIYKEVSRNRAFRTAAWAMDGDSLARLEIVAERLKPTTNAQRYAYLFEWHPDLPEIDLMNHEEYAAEVLRLRTQAVTEILAEGSIDGLQRLAEKSIASGQLGWVVGAVVSENLTPALLSWLDSENLRIRNTAAAWAERKLSDHGIRWLHETLRRPEAAHPARREAIALSVPARPEYWDALNDIDPELINTYWKNTSARFISAVDIDRAARELLSHGRAWAAVQLIASPGVLGGEGESFCSPALVAAVLDKAIVTDPAGTQPSSLAYEVGRLLDYLERENVEFQLRMRYEFALFRFLEDQREPRALFKALDGDPSFFVDLISRIYRGRNEVRRQLSEHDEAIARHAWWIIKNWRNLPGRRDDDTVDAEHLNRWVREARLALAEADRADVGDEQIGEVLAASPAGADGIWPAEPVRELLEVIGSPSMQNGLHIGVMNDRGVTTRGVYDGGEQERVLASRYREWASLAKINWPRTARILQNISEDYERQAQQEDRQARFWADSD
ncbi:helix-turn-helix domain-containing protein [Pseudofrankia saprophytica]|uniref:helix-turn-helix domain-containing protein n=2 Tax=Pseudofrankia TaxID=2994363 RepID=UPI000234C842|nr:helix-turn-helix domain-containing protein [Pseudofrankia saprophytica]